MKSLQNQYSLLQAAYWAASCSLIGFIAIFLQNAGFSNTDIGLVAGASCLMACVISPVLSSLTARFSNISLQTFLAGGCLVSAALYLSLVLFSLPKILIMILYMSTYCLNTSLVPLLSSISMDYISRGEKVNFGLSRGMGSISYALSAIVFTQAVSWFSPDILAWIFLGGSLLLILLLFRTPAAYASGSLSASPEKSTSNSCAASPAVMVKRYPKFILMLGGFALLFAASSSLATYLVNIMKNVGGSESLYGICVFAMAASELPVLFATPNLIRRFGCRSLLFFAGGAYLLRNALVCIAPNVVVLMSGLLLQGISFGLMTGVMTYYIHETLQEQDQIAGQTFFIAATSGLGGAMGNFLGGMLQDSFGLPVMISFCLLISIIGALTVMKASARPRGEVLIHPVSIRSGMSRRPGMAG